jgi:hypothetical protein
MLQREFGDVPDARSRQPMFGETRKLSFQFGVTFERIMSVTTGHETPPPQHQQHQHKNDEGAVASSEANSESGRESERREGLRHYQRHCAHSLGTKPLSPTLLAIALSLSLSLSLALYLLSPLPIAQRLAT